MNYEERIRKEVEELALILRQLEIDFNSLRDKPGRRTPLEKQHLQEMQERYGKLSACYSMLITIISQVEGWYDPS